jgi:hypothetical protein
MVNRGLAGCGRRQCLLAACESMRGGGARPRVGGESPSDLLLKVALEVAARTSLGEMGSGVAGACGGAEAGGSGADTILGQFGVQRGVFVEGRSQAGAVVAQTWSASCRMSMSMPHEEHLIIGRPPPLIRFMVGGARVRVGGVLCEDGQGEGKADLGPRVGRWVVVKLQR